MERRPAKAGALVSHPCGCRVTGNGRGGVGELQGQEQRMRGSDRDSS